MNRRLRQRHRLVFVALAIGLPTLLVAGLSARRAPVSVDAQPSALVRDERAFEGDWNHPDPLLYWSADAVAAGGELPPDARLIGSVREGAIVPAAGASLEPDAGHWLVYSLATQEVVETINLASGGGVR